MNRAVTFGVKYVDGKPVFTLITDPNTSHKEQRKKFRVQRRQLHGEYDEVQLWTSSAGRVKKQKTTSAALPVGPEAEKAEEQEAETAETSSAESTNAAQETTVSGNSGAQPTPTPVPDKKAAALAKARAAAAEKKKAKVKADKPTTGADLLG